MNIKDSCLLFKYKDLELGQFLGMKDIVLVKIKFKVSLSQYNISHGRARKVQPFYIKNVNYCYPFAVVNGS